MKIKFTLALLLLSLICFSQSRKSKTDASAKTSAVKNDPPKAALIKTDTAATKPKKDLTTYGRTISFLKENTGEKITFDPEEENDDDIDCKIEFAQKYADMHFNMSDIKSAEDIKLDDEKNPGRIEFIIDGMSYYFQFKNDKGKTLVKKENAKKVLKAFRHLHDIVKGNASNDELFEE